MLLVKRFLREKQLFVTQGKIGISTPLVHFERANNTVRHAKFEFVRIAAPERLPVAFAMLAA